MMMNYSKNDESKFITSFLNDEKRSIDMIKDIVAVYYKSDFSVYESRTRKSDSIKTKHVALFICMRNMKIGIVKLGQYFYYNHAMVVHINKKYTGFLEWDNEFKKEIKDIEDLIKFKTTESLDINKDYYYISLNEFHSIKQNDKAIIFKGFTDEEVNSMAILNGLTSEPILTNNKKIRKHTNQKFYILEKNKNEENNDII